MKNHNLFCALRDAFPHNLDEVAVETTSPGGEPLNYSWRDLERMSARIANLLDSLKIPSGSRVAVQVEKSVEAMALYLATLRAGYVFLPLNTAYQSAEIEYFVTNAEPAVVVCSPQNFGWVSKIAFQCGTQSVFTLGDDRSGTLLERAVHCSDEHEPAVKTADDMAAILYTSGTTGRSKGAMLSHGNLLSNAVMLKDYWGWEKGDVLIHALPIFHVHGLFVAIHAALLNGSKTEAESGRPGGGGAGAIAAAAANGRHAGAAVAAAGGARQRYPGRPGPHAANRLQPGEHCDSPCP